MAHFYANIQGNRSERTACGTKNSGISGHIRGWDIGAWSAVGHANGKDIVTMKLTSGSNGGKDFNFHVQFDGEKITINGKAWKP